MENFEIIYEEIEENKDYEAVIMKVLDKCYEVENLTDSKLSICITLTNPEFIKKLNKEHRDIDYATDVLSFPVLYKEEIEDARNSDVEDTLGDIEAQKIKYCFNSEHTIVKNWPNETEIEIDEKYLYNRFGNSTEYLIIKALEKRDT